ncbi:MAG: hypothetical protein QNJ97_11415 [Myxococcota bacterium]|nr:hypothetical protein [Myxococcota bacterium]
MPAPEQLLGRVAIRDLCRSDPGIDFRILSQPIGHPDKIVREDIWHANCSPEAA